MAPTELHRHAVDRRRYSRHRACELGCSAWLGHDLVKAEELEVANVSYGGTAVAAPYEWILGEQLLVSLSIPDLGQARVRCAVRWIRTDESGKRWAGLEFVESDQGWLGPEDPDDSWARPRSGLA